jgi:predicted flavoprotein YhiN
MIKYIGGTGSLLLQGVKLCLLVVLTAMAMIWQQSLGHNITDIFPALVQLMLEGTFFKRIEGVKFVGTAEVIHNNKSIVKDRGDILFANYGVSGPPILQISRKAGELLNEGKDTI